MGVLPAAQWVFPAGEWPQHLQSGTVTLGWDDRHRRRLRLTLDADGGDILLDLKQAARLGDGDGLLLDDGSIVQVIAAPEPLLEIRAGRSSLALLAYHLGNRHLPVQVLDDRLLIRADHVIAAMVLQLGAECREVTLPFTPEAGAYGGGHSHDHDHHAGHAHDHSHE